MTSLKRTLKSHAFQFTGVLTIILFNCFSINTAIARPSKFPTASFADIPLKAFEGIYQQKNNEFSYLQVTVEKDKLVAKRMDGTHPLTLTRKSELNFDLTDDDGDENSTVTFSKNEAGEITQALVADRDAWIKVKSYTPPKEIKLTPEQLKAFEGKYQFEERSEAFLQITATADGLLLKQLWDGQEIKFAALSDVMFLNKDIGFPLKFTKDEKGNVIKVLAFNRDLWDKVKQ